MNKITTLIDGVKSLGSDGMNSLKTISTFFNYLMHPSLVVNALWQYTLVYSFWICLLVAMLCAVFYALGFKKCGKFIPASMAIYTLILTIGSAF